jgi:hypothetical protein
MPASLHRCQRFLLTPIPSHMPDIKKNLYVVMALCLIIVSSSLVFFSMRNQSLTIDEPNHLTCGIEWLQHDSYTLWPENPPLSRAVVALGPHIDGFVLPPPEHKAQTIFEYFVSSYNQDYFSQGLIQNRLVWMRIFVLPFFLLMTFLVWHWTRRNGDHISALIALGLICFLPPLLAHSALATTDVVFATTLLLSFYFCTEWVKKPSVINALLFGLATGTALCAKFSILLFLPVFAVVMITFFLLYGLTVSGFTFKKWLTSFLLTGMLALLVTSLFTWAMYGFSVGTLAAQPVMQVLSKEAPVPPGIMNITLPAPELFSGLILLIGHHINGALTYTNDSMYVHGVWYFYFLTVLLKTPLPFLLVMIGGFVASFFISGKSHWEAKALAFVPIVFLLISVTSNINYGIRHFLIIYPLSAIGTTVCLYWFLRMHLNENILKLAGAFIVIAVMAISIKQAPDQLSYFNAIAGDEPGEYLVDSDLDWGQSLFQLAEYQKVNNIDSLYLGYMGFFNSCWYPELRLKHLPPDTEVKGWVAVTETVYRGLFYSKTMPIDDCTLYQFSFDPTNGMKLHSKYRWLDKHKLVTRIGGIRLYHVE